MNITEPFFDEEEIRLVKQALDSKWVTQGAFTAQFEQLFSEAQQVSNAIATTSCTAALHLSLLALGVGPGDEVIVPAFTWVTSAHAIEYTGAKAVFLDVDPNTFNLDPKNLDAALTCRTKAIIVVHLFGKAAPMRDVLEFAKVNNLRVIEDAACAVGTKYEGKFVGDFGDLGCFSFHPRKVITTGEGGMVTTSDEELVKSVMALRNHGATPGSGLVNSKPYSMGSCDVLGMNLRMSDIQAAVGVAQMSKLRQLLEERRRLALRYTDALSELNWIQVPQDDQGHTYQSFVILVREGGYKFRNKLMESLAGSRIQTRPGTHSVHQLGYYAKKYGYRPEDYPSAVYCENNSVTLPIFPSMSAEQQDEVINKIYEHK